MNPFGIPGGYPLRPPWGCYYRRRYPGRLPADYQLPLIYTRILVVLINIPLIVLGARALPGYRVDTAVDLPP